MSASRLAVITIAVALCRVPTAALAQPATVQGIVSDSGTGVPLEYVTITLEAGGQPSYRAITDRNGFYQILGISAGTYTLRSQRVGYQEHAERITLAAGEQRTVSLWLAQSAVALEGDPETNTFAGSSTSPTPRARPRAAASGSFATPRPSMTFGTSPSRSGTSRT